MICSFRIKKEKIKVWLSKVEGKFEGKRFWDTRMVNSRLRYLRLQTTNKKITRKAPQKKD